MKLFVTTEPTDSRVFLEKVLREYYAVPAPRFFKNEHGKPYLAESPLFFNLSHSGNITAVVVSEQEAGLDIQLREERDLSAVLRRLSPAERSEDFFALWTAKEAYIKYKGESLASLLSALEYRGGTLYENGNPIPAHLYQTEMQNCAVCVCTASPEEVTFIRL
ncbi:MAG: 4'-phosphopantetheinyl transferase superfamily protein [Clostridia bacterium]|nr:4'-phosphopantetheinyl transferase superfamily protein [Clostridia bacterium]